MKKRSFCVRWIIGVVFAVWVSGVFASNAMVQLTGVRTSNAPFKARVVLTFSGIPRYTTQRLNNPSRLVFTLKNTQLKTSFDAIPLNGLPISRIQTEQAPQQTLRVILFLKNALYTDVFTLPATQPYGERLVIDLEDIDHKLAREDLQLPAHTVKPKTTPQPIVAKTSLEEGHRLAVLPLEDHIDALAKKTQAPSAKQTTEQLEEERPAQPLQPLKALSFTPKSRQIIVVIDPGHGGKDPGASGINGTHEKNVVLAISRALQKKLDQISGIHAVLTRQNDYYIGLRERLNLARKNKADMFIAIHADAFNNPYSSGSSVFALSARGASSEAARWLAEKENYSELGGVHLEDKNNVLRSVLIDLAQAGTINLSLQLGGHLLNELGQIGRLHHGKKVEQARFVVLKSPDIPSVLVETGFLSNEQEETHLRDPIYQSRLADALSAGILRYFKQYPPPGTLFAGK